MVVIFDIVAGLNRMLIEKNFIMYRF